jgi:hypothetical protein
VRKIKDKIKDITIKAVQIIGGKNVSQAIAIKQIK